MDLAGLEYDPLSNRYYPRGHVKRQLRLEDRPVEVRPASTATPRISILRTMAERVKMLEDGMYEISDRVCRRVAVREDKGSRHCGLPVSSGAVGLGGPVFDLAPLGPFRDWAIFHHECYFGGEGGVWRRDQEMVLKAENASVFQLFKSKHGDALICCSADSICRLEGAALEPVSVLQTGGFTSVVELDGGRLLVASTGGRLAIHHADQRMERLVMRDQNVAFQKMVLLRDRNSVLAQSFSNQLHLVDVAQMAHMGLLFGECDRFATDGDRLVLVGFSKTGRLSLHDYTDPAECILDLAMAAPVTSLEYIHESHQFIVIVKEDVCGV